LLSESLVVSTKNNFHFGLYVKTFPYRDGHLGFPTDI
jgi:hypothetical protein